MTCGNDYHHDFPFTYNHRHQTNNQTSKQLTKQLNNQTKTKPTPLAFKQSTSQATSKPVVGDGSTTLDRKRIYANPSSYPNPKSISNSNTNPNPNSNPKAQLRFRTEEMTSFFDQVYRYRRRPISSLVRLTRLVIALF